MTEEQLGEFQTGYDQSFDMPTDEDDAISKEIIKHLFSKQDLNFKTELSDTEIKIITKLTILSNMLKLPQLNKMVEEFKQLRVSKSRQGRKELVESLLTAQRQQKSRIQAFKDIMNV